MFDFPSHNTRSDSQSILATALKFHNFSFWKSKAIKMEIIIFNYKNTKQNVKTYGQSHMAEQNTRINRLVREL